MAGPRPPRLARPGGSDRGRWAPPAPSPTLGVREGSRPRIRCPRARHRRRPGRRPGRRRRHRRPGQPRHRRHRPVPRPAGRPARRGRRRRPRAARSAPTSSSSGPRRRSWRAWPTPSAAGGIACFGPGREAAQLEGSKAFAKEVMAAAGVPTALAHVCTTAARGGRRPRRARRAVRREGRRPRRRQGRRRHRRPRARPWRTRRACLAAGSQVVVEEFLDGPEVSLFCLTDGEHVVPLAPAQDFKRVGDGDAGPNTGGMGAYSPLDWAPAGLVADVVARVAQPTVDEMRRRGTPFAGVLYVGLALTSRGPRVIEFNARFGDPETQVVLARLRSPARASCCGPRPWAAWTRSGRCAGARTTPSRSSSPPPGYPGSPRTGGVVEGLAEVPRRRRGACTPAPPSDADGTVVAAGGPRPVGRGARRGPRRRRASGPTPRWTRSRSKAGTTAPTSRSRPPAARSPCRASAPADGAWRHHGPRRPAKLSP